MSRYKLSRSHKLSWYRELYCLQWCVSGFKVETDPGNGSEPRKKHDKQLTFIVRVRGWCSLFPVIFLSIFYIVSVCRAVGQEYSLAGFGLCVGFFCDLPMCMTAREGQIYNESIKSLILSHVHTLVLTPTMFVRSSVNAQIPRIFFFSSLAHSISHF